MQKRDSIGNTFLVATVLCLVCSALVSIAAVGLKAQQDRNVTLDLKKNILGVTGFSDEQIDSAGGINELFDDRFEIQLIKLDTGELALDEAFDAFNAINKKFGDGTKEQFLSNYDQVWASKSKKEKDGIAERVPKADDKIRIKYREEYSHVYLLKSEDGNSVEAYIFPIRGYGLWSMLKGFIALKPDFQTIIGITYYDQKETPGLGGEVVSPNFKAQWPGKLVYDNEEVGIRVVKAPTSEQYDVAALSGATITSNGVTNMLQYWLGPKGFKEYISKQKGGTSVSLGNTRNAGANNG